MHVKLLWRQNFAFLFCLTYYKKQTHELDKNLYRLNKNVFFVSNDPLQRSVSYVVSEKKVKIDILKILTDIDPTRVIMKKQKTLHIVQLLLVTRILVINKQ